MAATLTTATLAWDWPASALAFRVQYALVTRGVVGPMVVVAVDMGGNETTVIGLAARATYQFAVSARNKHLAGYLNSADYNLTMEGRDSARSRRRAVVAPSSRIWLRDRAVRRRAAVACSHRACSADSAAPLQARRRRRSFV